MGRTYLYVACEIKKRDGDVGLAQVRGRRERGSLGEQQKDVAGVEREVSTCYFRTTREGRSLFASAHLKRRHLPMWSAANRGSRPRVLRDGNPARSRHVEGSRRSTYHDVQNKNEIIIIIYKKLVRTAGWKGKG